MLGTWLREGVIVADDVIELVLVDPTSAGLSSDHIYLPCSGSVNQVVLHVDDSEVPEDLKLKVPAQFMLVFAGGVISTYLKRSSDGRYSVKMSANVLRDVIRLVRSSDKAQSSPVPEEDISVGGVIKGRALGQGAEWVDYVLGTVTFTCGPDDRPQQERQGHQQGTHEAQVRPRHRGRSRRVRPLVPVSHIRDSAVGGNMALKDAQEWLDPSEG